MTHIVITCRHCGQPVLNISDLKGVFVVEHDCQERKAIPTIADNTPAYNVSILNYSSKEKP